MTRRSPRPLRPAAALLLALPLLLAACGQPPAPVAGPVDAASPVASASPVAATPASALGVAGPGRAPVFPRAEAVEADTLRARATLTVTSLADSGPGTLRAQLAAAAPGDTIDFAVTGTITLLSRLNITKNVTVQGPGASALTLSGGGTVETLGVAGGVTFTLRGVTVSGSSGSGLTNAGTTTVENSVFAGNGNTSVYGGGFYNGSGATLTVRSTTVRDNTANDGPAVWSLGLLTVENSTVTGNRAYNGGIVQYGGAGVTVRNSTLSGNTSNQSSGALLVIQTTGTIVSSTITGNSSGSSTAVPSFSGAVISSIDAVVTIRNSLVAGNVSKGNSTSSGGIDVATINTGTFSSAGYNVIGTVTNGNFTPAASDRTGTNAAPLDAKLAPLADNGGLTLTNAIAPDSPASDLVPLASCTVSTDQRGVARPQGAGCDAGAYEFTNTAPTAPTLTGPVSATNASPVPVTWTAATDAESDPLTYTLEGRRTGEATFAPLFTGAALSASPALAEGTWTLRVKANDGALDGPYSAERVVKVDRTAPAAPGASVAGTLVNGWYRDSAAVSFLPGADPALPDGSSGSGTVFTTAAQIYTTTGVFSASGVSRDAAGNESTATTVNVQVDASLPTVAFANCAPQVTIGSTTSVTWTASDTGSGLATPASGSVPLDTATVGPKSVSVTSRDKVGHEITQTCAYTVVYPFGGFVGLQSPPNLNTSPYPYTIVTFTLGGNYGKEIYALGFPAYRTIDCTTKAPLSGWTPAFASTTTAGNATQYDAMTKRYQFGWSMTSAWTGCRELNLRTNDGVDHSLYFRR